MVIWALFTIAAGAQTNSTAKQKVAPAIHSGHFHNIDVKNMTFGSGKIAVAVGDTGQWTNKDNAPHMVTSNTGDEIKSPLFNPGQTFQHIFTKAGDYSYRCLIHPTMFGKVIVQ